MNIKLGKAICNMYHEGLTFREISNTLNIPVNSVRGYLKTYYEKIYDTKAEMPSAKRAKRLSELYAKYQQLYTKGAYSQVEMCKKLGCNLTEFYAMCRKYNLQNQWLKTYAGQVTLCNVPRAFREDINAKAKQFGYKSVRAFAVHAIVELMMYLEDKEE